jgi:tetratricopeptide (TPR) repeat protein
MPLPDDPLFKEGTKKLRAKDYIGALADFNQLIELNPSHFAYGSRAMARQSLGDVNGAIDDYTVAFKMSNIHGYQVNRGILRLGLWDLWGGFQDIYSGVSQPDKQK